MKKVEIWMIIAVMLAMTGTAFVNDEGWDEEIGLRTETKHLKICGRINTVDMIAVIAYYML